MSSETIVPEAVDNSQNKYFNSHYKYVKVLPRESVITPGVNSTAIASFQLTPNEVLNLSKTMLQFDLTIPAQQVAGGNPAAEDLVFIDQYSLPIAEISLKTANQTLYLNQHVQQFVKSVMPYSIDKDELRDLPEINMSTRSNWIRRHGSYDNAPITDLASNQGVIYNYYNATGSARTSLSDVMASYESYLATDGNVTIGVSIPLSTFKYSLLSLNHDLQFGNNVILSIVFAPTASFVHLFDYSVNVANTAMPVDVLTIANSNLMQAFKVKLQGNALQNSFSQPSAAHTLSNVQLLQAVQQDQSMRYTIQQSVKSGLQLPVTYLITETPSLNSTSTSATVRTTLYNSVHGRVLRVFSNAFWNLGTNGHWVSANSAGALVNNIRYRINGQYQSEEKQTYEQWLLEHSDIISDTSLAGDIQQQIARFTLMWDFSGVKAAELMKRQRDNLGITPDNNGVEFMIEFDKPAVQLEFYNFIICQKQLTVIADQAQGVIHTQLGDSALTRVG